MSRRARKQGVEEPQWKKKFQRWVEPKIRSIERWPRLHRGRCSQRYVCRPSQDVTPGDASAGSMWFATIEPVSLVCSMNCVMMLPKPCTLITTPIFDYPGQLQAVTGTIALISPVPAHSIKNNTQLKILFVNLISRNKKRGIWDIPYAHGMQNSVQGCIRNVSRRLQYINRCHYLKQGNVYSFRRYWQGGT